MGFFTAAAREKNFNPGVPKAGGLDLAYLGLRAQTTLPRLSQELCFSLM